MSVKQILVCDICQEPVKEHKLWKVRPSVSQPHIADKGKRATFDSAQVPELDICTPCLATHTFSIEVAAKAAQKKPPVRKTLPLAKAPRVDPNIREAIGRRLMEEAVARMGGATPGWRGRFAKRVGIVGPEMSLMLHGKRNLSPLSQKKLAQAGLDVHYIMSGERQIVAEETMNS